MKTTRLMLVGLVAGAVAFGTACRSDQSAEREEPAEQPTQQAPPEGTGGAGEDEVWTEPGEMGEDTGGAGDEGFYEGEDVGEPPEDVDAGTGGAGFEEEGDEEVEGEPFGDDEELGGSRFPTDDISPRQ